MKKKICIIGCGTFGSYLLKRLLEKHGDGADITVVEIGHSKTQSESEVGLGSISEHSKVSTDGRYFGFGGTSARWGGQVLFFDERDNPEGDATWNEIVRINQRHKATVLKNLLGENVDLQEDRANIKTGIWLKYAKRNLFKRLGKSQLAPVKMMPGQRVVDFNIIEGRLNSVVCRSREGQTAEVAADVFYLTAGALESCRLLLALNAKTGLLDGTDLGKNFGDHISTELFTVHGAKPVINGVDFTPRLRRGSLVTQRMIVQTDDGVIGFLHCVFNKDIKAFKFLKELMFGKRSTTVTFAEFIGGVVFLFQFVFHLLFKNKLYVDETQWSLQLDMEQPVPNKNRLALSAEKDQYGEAAIQIDWQVSKKDLAYIAEMRKKIEHILKSNQLEFKALYNPATTDNKVEDVYHPVGCTRIGHDAKAVVNYNGRVKSINNLYHFSTGIFPSAKSINPSAAVLCFVEECLAGEP
ncbi:MAG: hypothetical protein H6577_03115 [Lewinellaceae bacterium]|nr:hypothetical protein [Saprospiraceae bacterium]MCB9337102.1 hypothetical protein [Lewinellaceae bacterium]